MCNSKGYRDLLLRRVFKENEARETTMGCTIHVTWLITLAGGNRQWVLGFKTRNQVKNAQVWFQPVLTIQGHFPPLSTRFLFVHLQLSSQETYYVEKILGGGGHLPLPSGTSSYTSGINTCG
jgi:nitrate reductase gamma subunit